MCTSEIDFGHLVGREIRNFQNQKTSSRLAKPGAQLQLPLLEQSSLIGRTPQSTRRVQLRFAEFTVIWYFSAEGL